jgi:hypothetical protein
MDTWANYVRDAIKSAEFNPHRMLDITQEVIRWEQKNLVPWEISNNLIDLVSYYQDKEIQ